MKLSVGFLTGRVEPRLHWVLDALAAQAAPEDEIQVVVVDALDHLRTNQVIGDPEREVLARAPKIEVLVTAVRPNIWQGRYRITKDEWWATAASRNTFLCLAEHDYIAFLDDCCRIGPRWLDTVRQGERERASVLTGSFRKHVPDGQPPPVRDHRLDLHPNGKHDCGGGWLYGCTFCLPLQWALDVNGFEEGCDSIAGEDYMFGLMLEQHGRRIDFCSELHVDQEREVGDESCVTTFHKRDGGRSQAALARFGSRKRTEFTPDLAPLRGRAGAWPVPDPAGDHLDWFDGSPNRDATSR